MGEEHGIVRMVRQAKKDSKAADELIAAYMNFIRSETAKFNHSTPSGGRDDELSIAMFAFYEAIQGYEKGRGSFLSYPQPVDRLLPEGGAPQGDYFL